MKKSFVIRVDNRASIDRMPDADAGRLLKHIVAYACGDILPIEDEPLSVQLMAPIFVGQIDEENDRQEQFRAKRAECGRLGGLSKAKLSLAKLSEAKLSQAELSSATNDIISNSTKETILPVEKEKEIKESVLKNTKEKQEKFDLPTDGFWGDSDVRAAFVEYARMRIKIKKPLTAEATKRKVAALNRFATTKEEALEIIQRSTDNYWQDFYELDRPLPAKKKQQQNFEQRNTDYNSLLNSVGL